MSIASRPNAFAAVTICERGYSSSVRSRERRIPVCAQSILIQFNYHLGEWSGEELEIRTVLCSKLPSKPRQLLLIGCTSAEHAIPKER